MNDTAHRAIEHAWELTVKARALCPHTKKSAVGKSGYCAPRWYAERGANCSVHLPAPLTDKDIPELNDIGNFVNRSFVIWMAAILESFDVVRYGEEPDRQKPGGEHAQLVKWLRNRFAHGQWRLNPNDKRHSETLKLLKKLFPGVAPTDNEFPIPIDTVLEPLKNGVLEYIKACG